jgi:acyl carrier protein
VTILERLNQIFREVFDDESLVVEPTTTARDVDGWDSLMHVTLLVNVERAFQLKFTSSEIGRLQNVGQLVELIEARAQRA